MQSHYVHCLCRRRVSLGRSLCGCVCWGTALLMSLFGLPGPDAPADSDFQYKEVVQKLVNHAQVGTTQLRPAYILPVG